MISNFKKLIFNSFQLGLILNLLTVFSAIVYVLAVENYFKPFDFVRPVKLGTIVSGGSMFDFDNLQNTVPLPRWQAIEHRFDFFVPDVALRSDDRGRKSPRVERWCKINPCWAHRMAYEDNRRHDYKTFTVDDWFFNNRNFLNTRSEDARVFPLDVFLKKLSPGSVVILNEPLTLFLQHELNFQLFKSWVIILRRKHPHLKFQLGLQLHFQWLDVQWLALQNGVLFSQFSEFSSNYDIPWGVSEFSIYDRVWRRRLVATYDALGRRTDSIFCWFESRVPDRLRRAIVLHQAYLIHRAVMRSGASFIVEWGNFPTVWFSGEIDTGYNSTFALFDWNGKPLPMYWAVARGLTDGANFRILNR